MRCKRSSQDVETFLLIVSCRRVSGFRARRAADEQQGAGSVGSSSPCGSPASPSSSLLRARLEGDGKSRRTLLSKSVPFAAELDVSPLFLENLSFENQQKGILKRCYWGRPRGAQGQVVCCLCDQDLFKGSLAAFAVLDSSEYNLRDVSQAGGGELPRSRGVHLS